MYHLVYALILATSFNIWAEGQVEIQRAVALCDETARSLRSCLDDDNCTGEAAVCLETCQIIDLKDKGVSVSERNLIKSKIEFCEEHINFCPTAIEALSTCSKEDEDCKQKHAGCLKACEKASESELKQCDEIYAARTKPAEPTVEVAEECDEPNAEGVCPADELDTTIADGADEIYNASADDPYGGPEDTDPPKELADEQVGVHPNDQYYGSPFMQNPYGNQFGNQFGNQLAGAGPRPGGGPQYTGAQFDVNGGIGDGRVTRDSFSQGGSANVGAPAIDRDRFALDPEIYRGSGVAPNQQQAGGATAAAPGGASPATGGLQPLRANNGGNGRRRRPGGSRNNYRQIAKSRSGVSRVSTKGGVALLPSSRATSVATTSVTAKQKKAKGQARKRQNGALALLAQQEQMTKSRYNGAMRGFRLRGNLVNYDGLQCATMVFCNMEDFFTRQFQQGRVPASASEIDPASFK